MDTNTAIFRAYFLDQPNQKLIYTRITKNKFLNLACISSFKCMKIDHGTHLEYTAQTEHYPIYKHYIEEDTIGNIGRNRTINLPA